MNLGAYESIYKIYDEEFTFIVAFMKHHVDEPPWYEGEPICSSHGYMLLNGRHGPMIYEHVPRSSNMDPRHHVEI